MNNASKGRCVTITPSDNPKNIKLYAAFKQREKREHII